MGSLTYRLLFLWLIGFSSSQRLEKTLGLTLQELLRQPRSTQSEESTTAPMNRPNNPESAQDMDQTIEPESEESTTAPMNRPNNPESAQDMDQTIEPDLVNLLVRSEDGAVPMVYVQNFYLWTRKYQGAPQELVVGSQASILAAHFYPRRTYVIVHGFLGSGRDYWILHLKDALLSQEDCNVICVNWSSGAITIAYAVIQQRVPEVGNDISKLLKFLNESAGLALDHIHLIGHSLGAHAVGFAGKRLNGSLLRITGLDPAGPLYHLVDVTNRLDKSDAAFVDIIHTNGCTSINLMDCYGINKDIGDADFWPNGGTHQPACLDGDGAKLVQEGSDCNHGMAYVLYTESVLYPSSTTRFLARPCDSWKYFNNKKCPGSLPGLPVQYMGYNVNSNVSGRFFLNTSITTPYALLDSDFPTGAFSAVQLIECPMPFKKAGGTCVYIATSEIKTWTESRSYCKILRGDLVKIDTDNLHYDIIQLIKKEGLSLEAYWIGASDEGHEGDWRWPDNTKVRMGSPFWGYTAEHHRHQVPSGGTRENCATLDTHVFLDFNDFACQIKCAPICQYLG